MMAGLAGIGLTASILVTLWFFAGFAETDPAFAPASSAFLLSILLGSFAIIPCAVILRLAWQAWRDGFRVSHGVWTLFLMLPWIGFAVIAAQSEWLPIGLTFGPLVIAMPTLVWASASIILELVRPPSR